MAKMTFPDSLPAVSRPTDGYTVVDTWHPDVTIIYGGVPIDAMMALTRQWRRNGLFNLAVPRIIGASMVICRTRAVSDALTAWFCPKPAPGAGIAAWWRGPDVGASSAVMACRLLNASDPFHVYIYGRCVEPNPAYPHDAADLGRCFALLEACPEMVARVPEMAAASPTWARIVARWAELEKALSVDDSAAVYAILRKCEEPIADDARQNGD